MKIISYIFRPMYVLKVVYTDAGARIGEVASHRSQQFVFQYW